MRIEYKVVRFEMPVDWALGAIEWQNLELKHYEILSQLGKQGWEFMMHIGPLFYFKRVKESGKYTYESIQDGYVIFGPDGRKIPGWDLEELLNND